MSHHDEQEQKLEIDDATRMELNLIEGLTDSASQSVSNDTDSMVTDKSFRVSNHSASLNQVKGQTEPEHDKKQSPKGAKKAVKFKEPEN